MNARDRRLAWIGLIGGVVGVVVLNFAPLDGLLPLNRSLFALVCILIAIWVVAVLVPDEGDRS